MDEEYEVKVRIEGVSPLLQHRFPDSENVKDIKSRKVSGSRDYGDMCEKALYRLEDGTIFQPSEHIWSSLVKAAVNFKIAGRGKKTYKDLVKSAVFVAPDCIVHEIQDWVIDRRSVVIQRSRIMRERPRFDKWAISFNIRVIDTQLASDELKRLLDYAGTNVGIGDYRPRYGRFMVTKFENIEPDNK